jgi:DNA adenine methylase
MKKQKLTAPFGWVGGKSKLAYEIIEKFPEHKIYIEVFGGALNVLYRKDRSRLEVVNDINGELVNLHRAIRNNPETLSMYLNKLFISREIFNDIKKKKMRPTSNIERASFYLFLLTQSFGSKGDNFAMSAKAYRKPKDIYKSFFKWALRLKFVTIENLDFRELIKRYDKDDAFFYLDPPYVGTENYYKDIDGFGIKEHEELAEMLKKIKGKFLLSYNDSTIVRELYKNFTIVESSPLNYTLGANVHKRKKVVSELFIVNY